MVSEGSGEEGIRAYGDVRIHDLPETGHKTAEAKSPFCCGALRGRLPASVRVSDRDTSPCEAASGLLQLLHILGRHRRTVVVNDVH